MSIVPGLSTEMSLSIVEAARAAARAQGVLGISIVVLDIDGASRVALREDSQGAFGIELATAKARTALGFRRSTTALATIFTEPTMVTGLAGVLGENLLLVPGGIVIQDLEGRRLGAAGVAGGVPSADNDIICAAVRAAGLEVAP